jgi:predicted nucleic acid-binding protein
MHLFIDTNILLSFYHYTGDELEELKKLIVLLQQKKLQLYVPSQVVDEFNRNREVKIADAIKRLKEQHLNLHFPQLCKDYPQYAKLRDLQKQYQALHAELLNAVDFDVTFDKLKADTIISELFKLAKHIPCDSSLVQRARDRFELGNPPGKNGSLGDAVNWEALISAVLENADLHFITDDKDYCSALNEEAFNEFLLHEWRTRHRSKLLFYKRLSGFFKEHFPDIKLATELEKDLLIQAFAKSGSFASTHLQVAKLSKYSDFTPAQLNVIVAAAVANNQISMIADDKDVHDFLTSAIKGNEGVIDNENLEVLTSLLNPVTPDHLEVLDDDIPF